MDYTITVNDTEKTALEFCAVDVDDYLTNFENYWDGLLHMIDPTNELPDGYFTNWNRGSLGKGKVNALSAMSRACEWANNDFDASMNNLAYQNLSGNAGDGCAILKGCLDPVAIPCNRYLGGDGLEYCHYDSPYGCFCGDVDTDPNSDTYGQGIPLETSTIIYPGNCRYTESPLCQWCIDWCAFDGAELNPGVSIGDCRIPSPYVNTNDRCVDIWNECFENGGIEEICGADPIDDCFYNNVRFY